MTNYMAYVHCLLYAYFSGSPMATSVWLSLWLPSLLPLWLLLWLPLWVTSSIIFVTALSAPVTQRHDLLSMRLTMRLHLPYFVLLARLSKEAFHAASNIPCASGPLAETQLRLNFVRNPAVTVTLRSRQSKPRGRKSETFTTNVREQRKPIQ